MGFKEKNENDKVNDRLSSLMKINRRLKRHEARTAQLFDLVAEGVVYFTAKGKIEKLNSAARRILGIDDAGTDFRYKSPDWLLFKPECTTLRHDGTLMPPEERAVVRALKENRTVRNSEMGLKYPDGKVVWLSTNAVPVLSRSGKIQGVVYTFMDVTEQNRLSREKMRFTQEIVRVQEEERKRISRELHDDTVQYLALLNLELDAIIDKHEALPGSIKIRLQNLRTSAEKALHEIRRFSHELRPGILEHFGLSVSLELLADELNSLGNIKTEACVTGTERRLSDDVELALFRIAQEALNNIRKHSGASRAKVGLTYSKKKIKLSIRDNGCGFDCSVRNDTGDRKGLGIVGMRERAQLIGAILVIKSNPGAGTTVTVEIEA